MSRKPRRLPHRSLRRRKQMKAAGCLDRRNGKEKVLLGEEFLSQMHQRLLDGTDDFNYSEVSNPDYDYLGIVNPGAEESNFDEGEEEEGDMMQ
ncbi:hypothetical protein DNTS_029668 [Danionella cerebrum]|uniref:CCD97-like C-terminal domain-containing protein n=1 Tax=Danionella cerebrum TaxID=2873325 RepID=A0A553QFL3_9TELE|nr:hypothetical protein DNTS_029668 [Danionella translucida]